MMMARRELWKTALYLIVMQTVAACAADTSELDTEEPVSVISQALSGARRGADTPVDNATVWINGCTGTLVAPDVVLTCGHCFTGHEHAGVARQNGEWWPMASSDYVNVRFGATPELASTHTATGTSFNQVPRSRNGAHADILLFRLDHAVPSSVAVPRAIVAFDPGDLASKSHYVAGYGKTGGPEQRTYAEVRNFVPVGAGSPEQVLGTLTSPAQIIGGDSGGPTYYGAINGPVMGVTQGWTGSGSTLRTTKTFQIGNDNSADISGWLVRVLCGKATFADGTCDLESNNDEAKVDVNGDGRADVCGRNSSGIWCTLSTGTGLATATRWSAWSIPGGSDKHEYYSTLRFPDLNGDGRSDVCERGSAGVYCALSTGVQFGSVSLWHTGMRDADNWNQHRYYSTIAFPDLNDDGRADLCGRGKDGVWCGLSTGGAFSAVTLWHTNFRDEFGWDRPQHYSTVRFPDLNHDGRADLCGRGTAGILCTLNVGGEFGPMGLWNAGMSDPEWSRPQYYSTISFPELNGDGRADVCGRAADGVRCGVNSGSSFSGPTLWNDNFRDGFGWNQLKYYSTIRFPDLDGDGRADLCARGNGGVLCGMGTGAQFSPVGFWDTVMADSHGWDTHERYTTIGFADLNGDGRSDLCGRGSAGIVCGVNATSRFNAPSVWSTAFAAGWSLPQFYLTIQY